MMYGHLFIGDRYAIRVIKWKLSSLPLITWVVILFICTVHDEDFYFSICSVS
jgi:hypothetical protein